MGRSNLSERELLLLLEGECAASLSPAEIGKLEQALREDPQARDLYQNYMLLDAELFWRQGGAANTFPGNKDLVNRPGNHGSVVPLFGNGLMGDGSEFDPQATYLPLDLSGPGVEPLGIEATEFEALPSGGRARVALKPGVSSPRGMFDSSGWMEVIPWRLVGTCVFGLVLLGAMLFDLRPRVTQEVIVKTPSTQALERYSPPGALAMLISTIDCRWANRRVPLKEGASIYPEQLELVSGTADLLFSNGARVILEGPASLLVQGPGRAILLQGKLAAQVPKRAIGFTIGTPTVEVVDFGTQFGVAVLPQGVVDVAVRVGKVEVGSLQQSFGSRLPAEQKKRTLTAGQAVTAHRTPDHELVIDTANFNAILATSLAKPFESMARMPGKQVAYRVPDLMAGNRRDFHGGVGLDFEVRAPIRVFSLGMFDHLGDGIDPSTSPTVQLWSRDVRGTPDDTSDDLGGQVLASEVFGTGDVSELKQGHRFKPLSKPLELQPGSYSIVAYGLADGNPFVSASADEADSAGIAIAGSDVDGKAGGTFARNDDECYYGDTKLSQIYTLNSSISAKGTFTFSDAETMKGKFFVGHFSSSTADDRREFIGVEFVEGTGDGLLGLRARIYRFNGSVMDDAFSEEESMVSTEGPYHFEYNYDPNYEADASHAGPEGRLTLHVYNDADTFNVTLYAINHPSHRDVDSVFDAFGLGIATMQSEVNNTNNFRFGDDPTATAKFFLDDVTYSGHAGVVNFNIDPGWEEVANATDGNDYGWVSQTDDPTPVSTGHRKIEGQHSAIVSLGSRLGEGQPGLFPVTQRVDRKNNYGSGSFEYVPQQQQDTR